MRFPKPPTVSRQKSHTTDFQGFKIKTVSGIIINIDPVALRLGSFELRWYSIAILTALIAGLLVTIREAKRKGVSANTISDLLPWLVITGIAGARLFHVIDKWDYYSANPWQIVQLQTGGLAIWGALLAGVITTIVYAKLTHIPIYRLLDIMVPGLLIAQIIGRVGCIINGDAYGGISSLPWAFIYIHPDALIPSNLIGLPTHPYPVYEMLWNSLGLALVMKFRQRIAKDGYLFLGYLAFYSVGRLGLTFVRQENTLLLGFQQAQILAIVILLLTLALFVYELKKYKCIISRNIN